MTPQADEAQAEFLAILAALRRMVAERERGAVALADMEPEGSA
jgi:hypothetical protein